ncbi:hypothetical protein FGIG_10218 [Fasciola gigantica]|uniref:Uncharacterized protein n=1 Tax=Fasciola gigantica TaxID=46835 RepID=A0A504YEB6_FASGI|nr:hypothetical protein FGIG_10218 [Fasciola gigantica]
MLLKRTKRPNITPGSSSDVPKANNTITEASKSHVMHNRTVGSSESSLVEQTVDYTAKNCSALTQSVEEREDQLSLLKPSDDYQSLDVRNAAENETKPTSVDCSSSELKKNPSTEKRRRGRPRRSLPLTEHDVPLVHLPQSGFQKKRAIISKARKVSIYDSSFV